MICSCYIALWLLFPHPTRAVGILSETSTIGRIGEVQVLALFCSHLLKIHRPKAAVVECPYMAGSACHATLSYRNFMTAVRFSTVIEFTYIDGLNDC